jgi:hypothetical protein
MILLQIFQPGYNTFLMFGFSVIILLIIIVLPVCTHL